jgi:hypothetical protein
VQLKHLRPRAVVSYLLEYVPLDSGVEHHALAKSRETHPQSSAAVLRRASSA